MGVIKNNSAVYAQNFFAHAEKIFNEYSHRIL